MSNTIRQRGLRRRVDTQEIRAQDWKRTLRTNLEGVFLALHSAIPAGGDTGRQIGTGRGRDPDEQREREPHLRAAGVAATPWERTLERLGWLFALKAVKAICLGRRPTLLARLYRTDAP
jgi:NAD(P)-dependent dehydrogenase (short-subunit alcohol dehydrogenase family)